MPLAITIEVAALDDLRLDPKNPRLGRSNTGENVTQERVMELMRGWNLEELAVSFLESGFWPQEAVIVVNETLYGEPGTMVVVEGNRRIAALKYLRAAFEGKPVSRLWERMVDGATQPPELFAEVPFILADQRADLKAFLGFRHVTGIKEWDPAEKAEFIADLVDDQGLSYDEIWRRIGSRPEPVRRNYIAFRILIQIEEFDDEPPIKKVENRFSVLFLSLREEGVREFLSVDVRAEPEAARTPVPEHKLKNLADYVMWMFGTNDSPPLVPDSRDINDFGRILSSEKAVEYLRTTSEPSFDVALRQAGVEVDDIVDHVQIASDHVESALSRVHLHLDSNVVQDAVRRLALSAKELITKYPMIAKEVGMARSDDSGS